MLVIFIDSLANTKQNSDALELKLNDQQSEIEKLEWKFKLLIKFFISVAVFSITLTYLPVAPFVTRALSDNC